MTDPPPVHSPVPTTHPSSSLSRAPRPASKLILLILFLLTFLAGILALSQSNSPRPATPALPDSPSSPRIAALSPAIAVILHDLNLDHLIVGRHSHDLILDPSIPVCFDFQNADYEQLLAVNPTHILLQLQSQKPPPRLAELAATHHWHIHDLPILTLDDIRTATSRLASLFSPGADKPLLLEMTRAWSPRPNSFKGSILLLAALDPPSALGPGSWHHQILERLGGKPAITSGSPYITLDAEDILSMQPEAILLILPRSPTSAPSPAPSIDDLRRRIGRIATLDIPANRHNRLALIDNPLAHTPSTAMIGLADELAAILERWGSN